MTTCTQQDCDNGAAAAEAYNKARAGLQMPPLAYAAVTGRITGDTGGSILFETVGEDKQTHTFVLPKSNEYYWMGCPTTCSVGSGTGTLYLSTKGGTVHASDAPSQRIYGTTPNASGQTLLNYKWPDAGLGEAATYELELDASSIVVTGRAGGDSKHAGAIDLLDASLCGMRQDLVIRIGDRVRIRATENGLAAFKLPLPQAPAVTHITRRPRAAAAPKRATRRRST